jgi:hypothetical protein
MKQIRGTEAPRIVCARCQSGSSAAGFVVSFDKEEEYECNHQEDDGLLDKIAVLQFRIANFERQSRKIDSASDDAHNRHEDIVDQRIDDFLKRGTDYNAHCKVNYIALRNELSEFCNHSHGFLGLGREITRNFMEMQQKLF